MSNCHIITFIVLTTTYSFILFSPHSLICLFIYYLFSLPSSRIVNSIIIGTLSLLFSTIFSEPGTLPGILDAQNVYWMCEGANDNSLCEQCYYLRETAPFKEFLNFFPEAAHLSFVTVRFEIWAWEDCLIRTHAT